MVLAVAAGVVVAGITGALLAVPLLAVLNTAVRSLTADAEPAPTRCHAVDPPPDPTRPRRAPARPRKLRLLLRRLRQTSAAVVVPA